MKNKIETLRASKSKLQLGGGTGYSETERDGEINCPRAN